jgi:hypothetical protein
MIDDQSDDLLNSVGHPEFEVWNHLDSGWQMAYDDMAGRLPPDVFALYRALAAMLVELNFSLVIDPMDDSLIRRFQEYFPETTPRLLVTPAGLQSLFDRYLAGTNTWLNHAVELEIAGRTPSFRESVSRFRLLAPCFAERPVPERARPYLKEAVSTFVHGFDPACIALCRSTFEQVAKTVLIADGVYSEPQLKRELPTASTLLVRLRQSRGSLASSDAAQRLIGRGNTVLHRHLFDRKVLRQQAADSVSELVAVLSELLS